MIDHLRAIRDDEVLRKRLAKLMAQRCFRNTKLEDLHAGVVPDTKAGDYSDVKVVSPFGEIPWPRLSRLSDDEMRELMIDVVDHCYAFLTDLLAQPEGSQLIEQIRVRDPLPRWNEPVLRPSPRADGHR
jgi:hypothetical protein